MHSSADESPPAFASRGYRGCGAPIANAGESVGQSRGVNPLQRRVAARAAIDSSWSSGRRPTIVTMCVEFLPWHVRWT